MSEYSWRRQIIHSLQQRNKKEQDAFASLIHSHNKLLETADNHRAKNLQLTVEVEKLKHEIIENQVKAELGGGGGGGGKGEKTHALEKKLYLLQDELTELHKSKGANAQQIIDLNNALKIKETELQTKESRIYELESQVRCMADANKNLEQSVQEYSQTNQILTDEQQALQLAFTKMEEKCRKTQEDNNDLVSRWMERKANDADKLNAQNDHVYQTKQKKILHELQEAAKEPVNIQEGDEFCSPMMNFVVTIPGRSMQSLEAHEGEVNAIKWSPTGKLFATGGADRKLKLWEITRGKCETKGILMGCNASVMSVEFDYEESLLLAASNDFASRVWTLSDQRLRHTLTGHSGKVFAAKFLGDPNKVVSGSHDRTLKIWDLRSKACIKTIFAGSSCNDLVTIDCSHVISGHFDRKVRFWDSRADSSSKEINLQGRVSSLDLSPDKTTLLACTRDDTIILVDLRMNQVSNTLSAENFRVGCDWTRAVFSPDGDYVMAGSSDGTLYIWNVAKNKVESSLREHSHAIMACSWSPMGSSLLSCDKHRTVVYWADF